LRAVSEASVLGGIARRGEGAAEVRVVSIVQEHTRRDIGGKGEGPGVKKEALDKSRHGFRKGGKGNDVSSAPSSAKVERGEYEEVEKRRNRV